MHSIQFFYHEIEGIELEDMDDNDQANVTCQHAYVLKNWGF